MIAQRPRIGIVLTGGGARAAYQVGVLRAIADLVPKGSGNPFPIICGTSAGAVNAVALAADAVNFRRAVLRLQAVWKNFRPEDVYRADVPGVVKNSLKWALAAVTGGGRGWQPVSLLDNTPLRELLAQRVEFGAIQRSIDANQLYALAITCSGYTSGQSVCFYQGAPGIQPWRRARRIGVAMPIELDHLMASSALPFIFPAVRIHREYFGDGSMRQLAPVSPALHLGADRVLVVAIGRQLQEAQAAGQREKTVAYPTLAQIAGHALNSIFLDSMEVDLERLQRINRTLSLVPEETLQRTRSPLRQVDFMVISPSQELEQIALRHVKELPRPVRLLFRSVGATRRGGSTLLSYLLFGREFCRELIALGYNDTMAKRDNLRGFLGYDSQWYCELRNTAA